MWGKEFDLKYSNNGHDDRGHKFSGWFRFYEDVIHDPKILRLPNRLYRFWTYCLCLANQNGGYLPEAEDIAVLLPWRLKSIESMIETLSSSKYGLLDRDADGRISPHNWFQRQFRSDHSAERMREFRARKRGVENGSAATASREDSARFLYERAMNEQNPAEFSVNIYSGFVDDEGLNAKVKRHGAVTVTPPDTYNRVSIVDAVSTKETLPRVDTSQSSASVEVPTAVQTSPLPPMCVSPPQRNDENQQSDLFPLYWELFVRAGKALNDRDKELALRVWLNFQPEEHRQIIRWTAEQMGNRWSDAWHTPLPVNNLKGEGWKRVAETRTVRGPEAASDRAVKSILMARGYR
jgi:hypothetical protein